MWLAEAVNLLHYDKNHKRNDRKIQDGLEKYAIVDGGDTGRFGRGERRLRLPGQIHEQAREVDVPQE